MKNLIIFLVVILLLGCDEPTQQPFLQKSIELCGGVDKVFEIHTFNIIGGRIKSTFVTCTNTKKFKVILE